jgi:hypothetical protein
MATFTTFNLEYQCGGFNQTFRNPRYPMSAYLNGLSPISGQNAVSNPAVSENDTCQTSAQAQHYITNPPGSSTTGDLHFGFKCLFGCISYSTAQVSTDRNAVLKGIAGTEPIYELNVYVPGPENGYSQGVLGYTVDGIPVPTIEPWNGVVIDAFDESTGSFIDTIPFNAIYQGNNYPAYDYPVPLNGSPYFQGITEIINMYGFYRTDVTRTYQATAPNYTLGPIIYTFDKWLVISGLETDTGGGIGGNPSLFTAVQNSNAIAFALYTSKINPYYVPLQITHAGIKKA